MIILTQIFFLFFAQASGGAHGESHAEGIPTVVFYQAINLSIFLGILYWFGKDKVRAVFKSRIEEYHRLAQETAKAKKDLEYKKEDILRRTKQFKETSDQSMQEAHSESERYYQTEVEKSKSAALKLEKDALAQVDSEQAKLIEKLRIEALEMSIAAAQEQVSSLSPQDKQKFTSQVNQRIEGASV